MRYKSQVRGRVLSLSPRRGGVDRKQERIKRIARAMAITNFVPAIATEAKKAIVTEVRRSRIHRMGHQVLAGLSRMFKEPDESRASPLVLGTGPAALTRRVTQRNIPSQRVDVGFLQTGRKRMPQRFRRRSSSRNEVNRYPALDLL